MQPWNAMVQQIVTIGLTRIQHFAMIAKSKRMWSNATTPCSV